MNTYELITSIKPLISDDDISEDGEWKTYIGNNVQFVWIEPFTSDTDNLFFEIVTWKNL